MAIDNEDPTGFSTGKVIDGDTINVTNGLGIDNTIRIEGVDTEESVHVNKEKNTPAGAATSKFMKDVIPDGARVKADISGTDHFGRSVGAVTRLVNGVEVDMGLVALDQQLSTYRTEYGKHADPLKHEQYKEFYSTHVPYQYGSSEQPMTREEFDDMSQKHATFDLIKEKFNEGELSQDHFDIALANLYGDPNEVARYRRQLYNWDRPEEYDDPNSIRGIMRATMAHNPKLREQYNRAVRNGHLTDVPVPEKQRTLWNNLDTAIDTYSMMANLSDYNEERIMKESHTDLGLPIEELTRGLPENMHAEALKIYEDFGDLAAITYRDNAIEDVSNAAIFSDMGGLASFSYAVAGTIIDPTSLIGGAAIGKVGMTGARLTGLTATTPLGQNTMKMAGYATMGAADEAYVAAPRLLADHTYNLDAYKKDITFGAAFGAGLGGAIEYAVKPGWQKFVQGARDSADVNRSQIAEWERLKGEQGPVESEYSHGVKLEEPTAITPDLQIVQEQAKVVQAAQEATQNVARLTGEGPPPPDVPEFAQADAPQTLPAETALLTTQSGFVEWAAITDVSSGGFAKAHATLKDTFDRNEPMGRLLKSQSGLNRKINEDMSDEMKGLITKLNSDILHIVSAFPKGNIPPQVSVAIKKVLYTQKSASNINAMAELLGGASKQADGLQDTELLTQYVRSLENKTELWDGYDVVPVSTDEFITQQSAWLNRTVDGEDIGSMTTELPREISFLKDVVELNRVAKKKGDADFTTMVEQLNGMVSVRLQQREFGDFRQYADAQSFGDTVPLSVDEMKAQLKSEGLVKPEALRTTAMRELTKRLDEKGLVPRTKEYNDAMRQGKGIIRQMSEKDLRNELSSRGLGSQSDGAYNKRLAELKLRGRAAVSDAVNVVGKKDDFVQGTKVTEKSPDDIEANRSSSQGIENEIELDKLEKLANPADADVARMSQLRSQLENPTKFESVDLVGDPLTQDLLPRSFTNFTSVKAYENPDAATLKTLRKALNDRVIKKLGVKNLKGKQESRAIQKRLETVKTVLLKNKSKVTERMVRAGQWQNVEDVIRASDSIVADKKIHKANTEAAITRKTSSTGDTDIDWKAQLVTDIAEAKRLENKLTRIRNDKEPLGSTSKEDALRNVSAARDAALDDIEATKELVKNGTKSETVQPTYTEQVTEAAEATPITEQEIELIQDTNSGVTTPKVDNFTYDVAQRKAQDSYERLVEESLTKQANTLNKFVQSGERDIMNLAIKPTGALDKAGRLASFLTQDLATKFLNAKLDTTTFVGARLTEIGKGFGGNIRRPQTAAIVRDAAFKESATKSLPQLAVAMDKYAKENGKMAWGRMLAQQLSGEQSKLVNKFNREFFNVIESRKQGREVGSKVSEAVQEYADTFAKYMDSNHDMLVSNNIAGFTSARKIKNYVPHVWRPDRLREAVQKHGDAKVHAMFKKAYLSSSNGKNLSDANADTMATDQMKWIKEQVEDVDSQYMPTSDSRAKQRAELDTSVELDGLSILDVMETDLAKISTKYSNRLAGWVSLSKATDGAITSQLDVESFKKMMIQEGKDKGIDTKNAEQWYDDMINLLFARPTRGGLTPELQAFKDLTALTRMGGLGMAQLAETGSVITRSVLSTFSKDPVIRRVFKMAGESADDKSLMREIQSVSNITDDLEWVERFGTHLIEDQKQLAEIGKLRQFSLKVADSLTFGKFKAPASRLLGKMTGYNAIRRHQSRITQASFTVDVARHFKAGKGKMGNLRMADVGLTDSVGRDAGLEEAFSKYVEFDEFDLPVKLNFDKWPPATREKFQLAMLRDEAQQIQRTMVGELPPWMNKPMMGLVFQFRNMPIVANNKQLGRSLAFADREAMVSVMLNTSIAGMVRYSKFAALGLGVAAITGEDPKEPTLNQMQPAKYVSQFGIFADATDFAMNAWDAGTAEYGQADDRFGVPNEAEKFMGQLPVLGLINDYIEGTTGDKRERIDAAFGVTPLGNIQLADMLHTWVLKTFDSED